MLIFLLPLLLYSCSMKMESVYVYKFRLGLSLLYFSYMQIDTVSSIAITSGIYDYENNDRHQSEAQHGNKQLLSDTLEFAKEKNIQNLCDHSFQAMKDAYYDDDWQGCVKHGLTASKLFQDHLHKLVSCRRLCKHELVYDQHQIQNGFKSDAILALYGKSSLRYTTCVGKCVPPRFLFYENLLKREQYDYIQICYYKLKLYVKGAAAATTFLVVNPKHDYMSTNLANYREHLGVPEDDLIDLEAAEYQKLYKLAVNLYEEKKWSQQLQHSLAALDSYYDAYENCSVLCETGYAVGIDHHEFIGAVADQMEEVIKCKYGCTSTLSRLDLKIVDNILLNIYHHLQYSYSQVGDYKSGAEYAAAFLLHDPLNANMLTNKKYLMQEKNVPEKWFQPPQREVEHKQRLDTLAELMQYIHTEYVSQHSLGKKRQKQLAELEGFLGGNIKVNATAADLGGTERFVADGFATPEQCSHLINMCQMHGVIGDGYSARNPLTKHEIFQGLMINTAQQLVEEGKLVSPLLSMYLELSENTRRYTQMYFNLHELYFDFTHLVCRTALDERSSRDDLSHPVHADNCAIQKDGTCHKTSSSYTHRAYSGLLYLNDNFEGGEFFFTDNHKHEQSSVKPKCGRLVAFNAGDYHGVKAVRSGRRCALAVWFTLDPHHSEQSRADARDMLDKLHNHNLVHDEL